MALDRFTQITESGIKTGITLNGINVIGVVTATTLSVSQGFNVTGVVTATSFNGNVTGNITPSGLVISGVSTFQDSSFWGDGDVAYFGDGQDLLIFHNSTDSIIRDNGTGDLFIEGGNRIKMTNPTGIETYAVFNQDGAVELWFDNSKELETTGYGATVFGILQTQGLQSSGITTLGVTSATNFTTQQANISGITTLGVTSATNFTAQQANISGISTLGVTTATNFTAQQANISGISTLTGNVIVGSASSITVGQSFIRNNQIGLGQTTTTGRNAGVGTAAGTIIYNSTDNQIQYYNGTSWTGIRNTITVTGGTVSDARAGFKVHTFTADGNFTITGGDLTNAELLVVAGGAGGGGSLYGAGGGAGGVHYATGLTITSGTHPADIGPGGSGGSINARGGSGTDSIFGPASPSPFYRISKGGGGGGVYTSPGGPLNAGAPGGSGGGAGSLGPSPGGSATQPSQNPGKPGTNYGNDGGAYPSIPGGYAPAGGGGAGGAGVGNLGTIPGGGNGGDGQPISITGSSVRYGAGGSASIYFNPPYPATAVGRGGNGGGGNGAITQNGVSGSSPNINGVANTGSGGAGAHGSGAGGPFNNSTTTGGAGGSGIIIIAYPTGDNSVIASPG